MSGRDPGLGNMPPTQVVDMKRRDTISEVADAIRMRVPNQELSTGTPSTSLVGS